MSTLGYSPFEEAKYFLIATSVRKFVDVISNALQILEMVGSRHGP